MMQQPICQPEQIGSQQSVGHQMVLCPVRLVYETQILVQPGDQIHPNQTIFINPQNTPPWAQNRQAQNQILYVQQVPSNMAPSLQQHLDQNQLYLQQNYNNYQMQQAIMAQNSQEQIRPGLQITNMIPSNMIQHLQANVNSNIQGERNIGQQLANFTQTHPNNQVANVIQNPIVQNNRQIMTNIGAINQSNQSSVNTQTAELQRQGIYMNVRPQGIHQQVNQTRPIMTMNTTQNATNVQNMQQNFGQSFVQNVGPRAAQIQSNINVPRGMQPMNMIQHIQTQVKPVEVVSTAVNVSQSVVNNPLQSIQTFAYRPIHPRPQYRQISYSTTMNNQTQTATQSMPKNIPNINNDNRFISPPTATTVGTAIGYVNTDHPFNRKRKSESPDEVKKKVAISSLVKESITGKYGSMTVKNISTSSEIGVNTSPIHRSEHKNAPKSSTVVQINHNETKIVKYVDNVQQTTLTESGAMKPATVTKDAASQNPNTCSSSQNEKDKMIRNTVYTQARGRLLNDKEDIKVNENVISIGTKQNETIEKSISDETKPNLNEKLPYPLPNNIDTKHLDILITITKPTKPKEVVENSLSTKLKEFIEKSLNEAKNDISAKQNDIEMKTATTVSEKTNDMPVIISKAKQEVQKEQEKSEPATIKEEKLINKEEKPTGNEEKPKVKEEKLTVPEAKRTITEAKPTVTEAKTTVTEVKPTVKEEKPTVKEDKPTVKEEKLTIKGELAMQVDDNIVREKQFTLTHVLDGYVIQESNIAFPIRKPLKEKTLYTNAQELMEQQSKWDEDTTNKIKDEILKDSKSIDLPVLPFHCLHLNNDKKEKEEEEAKNEEVSENDNPFQSLQQSTLKSWTVDQVAAHLSKYEWSQTVSILQEHEIDGESLFLVTKSQLVNIGVSEEHAEAICEFVKS